MENLPVPVFICHADQDASLLRELEQHLAPLDGSIDIWHRGRVAPGTEPMKEASVRLGRASLIVHLVSSDYLASDLCRDEAKQAISREKDGVTNVAIIARACLWRSAMCVPAAVLPSGGMPVASWPNRDEAWTKVAEGVQGMIAIINRVAQLLKRLRVNNASLGEPSADEQAALDALDCVDQGSAAQNIAAGPPGESRKQGEELSASAASPLIEVPGSVHELLQVLEDRAASIRIDLHKYYSYVAVQEYLAEFEALHAAHMKSLREGMVVRAHELARRIHRLSWRLEADNCWRKHQLETPSVRYCHTEDAFTRGPMALTYLPKLKVRQSPHSSITQPTTIESYLEALRALQTSE
ncbi:TIR domain-containing protein [Sorangium sp. So ce315]|uniref:TIR domain-containing protein n=1 Tax=Sorangium sp. So ce315 TaxID=3133299 RepID=UPI003F61AC5C